jgi:hypothetical protein
MAWLGACRSHGTVEMGEHVAKQALVGCARFNINCNSGFLCQTWEDPSCSNPDVEDAFGDNDPGEFYATPKKKSELEVSQFFCLSIFVYIIYHCHMSICSSIGIYS